MNKQQKQVQEFHEVMGLPVGDLRDPAMTHLELRTNLIREEFEELMEAIEEKRIVDAIDALCDLKYVIDGTAVTWGIDLEPFFDEVHRSNMTKRGALMRADGKILKPENWAPPRLAELLVEQIDGKTHTR